MQYYIHARILKMHAENGPVIWSTIENGFKNGSLLLATFNNLISHNAKPQTLYLHFSGPMLSTPTCVILFCPT